MRGKCRKRKEKGREKEGKRVGKGEDKQTG